MLVCVSGVVLAQSQKDLERRRQELTQQIKTTSRLLKSSEQSKEAALDRLVGLQRQIVQREELILTLRQQTAHADASLERTQAVINSMQADVDTISAEYGRLVRAALRQNITKSRLSFLLAAEGVGDAFQRVQYLRRYDENRSRQLKLIEATREALASKISRLDEIKAEKNKLLTDALRQQSLLENELSDKNKLLAALSGDEKRLRTELAEQNRIKQELDDAIDLVIKKAQSSAEKKRSTRAVEESAKTNNTSTERSISAPEVEIESTLAADFVKFKGKLPWPVSSGYVSKPFGKRAHPTLPRVLVNNNGVDIRTDPNAEVKAIFAGEVVGLQKVPGYQTMVILKHGNYYSVYSNLVNVRVKPGALVGSADILGQVAVDATTTTSELHFEVWKDRSTQNPTRWIKGLR